MSTQDGIIKIIAERLELEEKDIKLNTSLNDLGADSLEISEIIMKIEDFCNIAISDEQESTIKTVQNLIDLVTHP
jgi:acyl carrier protein